MERNPFFLLEEEMTYDIDGKRCMKGNEFFTQVAARPPFSKMHPAVAAFFKDYLSNEKAITFIVGTEGSYRRTSKNERCQGNTVRRGTTAQK